MFTFVEQVHMRLQMEDLLFVPTEALQDGDYNRKYKNKMNGYVTHGI